jgi:hypothetical protein
VTRSPAAALVLLALSGLGPSGQAAPGQTSPSQTSPSQPYSAPQPSSLSERDTKTLNLAAYAELLRTDVRAEKVAIITEVMGFTEAEDKAFWPIHREYESEMAKLGDERVALVAEYARSYSAMSDDIAHKLGARALDLEAQRDAVKSKYFERFSAALSPRTSLRFLQVEQQLLLLIDLQIASSLPIVQ